MRSPAGERMDLEMISLHDGEVLERELDLLEQLFGPESEGM